MICHQQEVKFNFRLPCQQRQDNAKINTYKLHTTYSLHYWLLSACYKCTNSISRANCSLCSTWYHDRESQMLNTSMLSSFLQQCVLVFRRTGCSSAQQYITVCPFRCRGNNHVSYSMDSAVHCPHAVSLTAGFLTSPINHEGKWLSAWILPAPLWAFNKLREVQLTLTGTDMSTHTKAANPDLSISYLLI